MNKKIILISIAILLAIGGGMVYLLAKDTATDDMPVGSSLDNRNTSNTDTTVPASTQTSPGAYIDYSDTIVANTKGTKLLFFHAPWCPQCRALDADIKEKGVPSGVTIIKTDYDSHQSLRQKYGITIQTTFVKVDDNGELIEKYVAYDDPTLQAVITNLL